MLTRNLFILLLVAAGLVANAPLAGAAYSVFFDPGTLHETDGISGFGTTGDMMAGMEVTAYFSEDKSELAIWEALTPPEGEAAGSNILDWNLNVFGDTYGASWKLYNNTRYNLLGIHIDAIPGQTMFDRTTTTTGGKLTNGTPGSAFGRTFEPTGDTDEGLNIVATYYDVIALDGFDPVGDLYKRLEIRFTNTDGLAPGDYLHFVADTDNIEHGGEIPEPSTALLLAAGLIGGGILYRRKHRK